MQQAVKTSLILFLAALVSVTSASGQNVNPQSVQAKAADIDRRGAADRIQSRLIQLYYFRDEERVAEIISHNLTTTTDASVKQLLDQLDKVRQSADETAVQRRVAEVTLRSLAKRSAQTTENDALVSLTNGRAASSSPVISPEEMAALEDLRRLEKQEQNLRARQFLLESQTDGRVPDSYSTGDLASLDPVSQVSLHIVGKGQIHLRGPLNGINKIARMIAQIDKPVGQVKVGIYSVQVNLSQNVKADDIHEMIEQHINHARFLSFQSALLFRQAVDKVAREVAGGRGGRAFAEDFFCDYFVNEMGKVEGHSGSDSAALQTLGSFNALNLIGALYLTALAEDSIRDKILEEFMRSVTERVPNFELDYCRSLKENKTNRSLASGMLIGCFQRRPAAISNSDIVESARSKLRFAHLRDMFHSQDTGASSYNSVQAATIELILGLKRLRVAELELSNLRLERALSARESKVSTISRADSGLIDQFIDEQEAKVVDLRETLRSSVAAVDAQLKQMAIAFEEDIQAQFYKPAFAEIRQAAECWNVSLGQIETTTVITNDRMVAKVSPGQTTQLDLPKRRTLIGETVGLAEAIAGESRSVAARVGSQGVAGPVGTAVADATNVTQSPGASLEHLIPKPDVYSFEAGNQFEITPIIQPDGESIAYQFLYTYSNDVSEGGDPGDPGFSRIKRHYVKTEVQSTSYELREISRFRIALSARRQGRGIPLLSDIPLLGMLAKPLPSLGYGRQENIILADCVVYPTIFNLIGNDWLHPSEDSAPGNLFDEERKLLARRSRIRQHLLSISKDGAEAILAEEESRSTVTMPSQPPALPINQLPLVAEPPQTPSLRQAAKSISTEANAPVDTASAPGTVKRTNFTESTPAEKSDPPLLLKKHAEDNGWQKGHRTKPMQGRK